MRPPWYRRGTEQSQGTRWLRTCVSSGHPVSSPGRRLGGRRRLSLCSRPHVCLELTGPPGHSGRCGPTLSPSASGHAQGPPQRAGAPGAHPASTEPPQTAAHSPSPPPCRPHAGLISVWLMPTALPRALCPVLSSVSGSGSQSDFPASQGHPGGRAQSSVPSMLFHVQVATAGLCHTGEEGGHVRGLRRAGGHPPGHQEGTDICMV